MFQAYAPILLQLRPYADIARLVMGLAHKVWNSGSHLTLYTLMISYGHSSPLWDRLTEQGRSTTLSCR
jgi:hypothetical protein